jgi:hypothetical protein
VEYENLFIPDIYQNNLLQTQYSLTKNLPYFKSVSLLVHRNPGDQIQVAFRRHQYFDITNYVEQGGIYNDESFSQATASQLPYKAAALFMIYLDAIGQLLLYQSLSENAH